ncbi:jg11904 [Pararge aegeria aegeria]|uniref:Jg11904 protein n=1 Tax=Pararge aegeria aegeria TaxID=348720 RepID=A0A8S4RYS4_9NEOP|nr:jg11904 [Pararge aegeria aegeria]
MEDIDPHRITVHCWTKGLSQRLPIITTLDRRTTGARTVGTGRSDQAMFHIDRLEHREYANGAVPLRVSGRARHQKSYEPVGSFYFFKLTASGLARRSGWAAPWVTSAAAAVTTLTDPWVSTLCQDNTTPSNLSLAAFSPHSPANVKSQIAPL